MDYTPNNTFIFSFVRMNPPTPGHLLLVKKLIDAAINLDSEKVYILTSSSLDGKNPLPCSLESIPKPKNKSDAEIIDRIKQSDLIVKSNTISSIVNKYKQKLIESEADPKIKSKIEQIQIIVQCSVGSPFGFIFNVVNNDFLSKGISKIHMYFVVGRDRADFLDTIVDTFRTKDYVKSIDGVIQEREGMQALRNTGVGERNISDINPSEYSASFVRGLVKNGRREDFEQVYSEYLSPQEIQQLYDTIKLGTQMKSPPSKEEDENARSKYFDGGLLPILVTDEEVNNTSVYKKQKTDSLGGKRRKSRKNMKKTRKSRKSKRGYTKRR